MSPHRTAWLLLASSVVACTNDAELLSPAQREVVAEYVTTEAPSPKRAVDEDFGRRVRLLGYDLDRDRWHPGDTMRVTWHWRVDAPPESTWKLVTRIEGGDSKRLVRRDENGTIRWLYGPEHWRAGQYIRDEQTLHLPDDWTERSATLVVGFENGKTIRAVTLLTPADDRQRKQVSLPQLRVVQTRESPRLDGSLDDAGWDFAQVSPAFVEPREGGPAPFRAFARLLWDRRYLYLGVEVQDDSLRASHTERDSHLWEQDCVEVMLDPNGDGENYFEVQVSPRGVVFDTRYDRRRIPKPFGHVDWDSRTRVGVTRRGELDDARADAGYTVEMAIPWQAFSLEGGSPISPPEVGETWRGNLYVMDRTRHRTVAAAWSPLGIGDFHVPHRFGILVFEGASEDMPRHTEPSTIPPGRMPAPLRRGSRVDPELRDTMIRKRESRRRLESAGPGH